MALNTKFVLLGVYCNSVALIVFLKSEESSQILKFKGNLHPRGLGRARNKNAFLQKTSHKIL